MVGSWRELGRGALDDSVLLGSKRNGDSTDGMDSLDVYAHSCRTCRYSDCLADTSQTQTIVLAQISCDWFAFSITDSHADFFPCTASTRIYIRGMIHRSPEKQDAQVVDNQRNVPVLFLGSLPPAGRGWSANKSLQATRDGGFLRRQGYGGQASSAIAEDVISPACLSSGR